MTTHELANWLDRYGKAWIERDPVAAAELFAGTARYHETPFGAPMIGRDAVREYWENVPRFQADVSFRSRVLSLSGVTGIVHWNAAFTRVPTSKRVELDGIFVLTFDSQGLCTELREWWHRQESS